VQLIVKGAEGMHGLAIPELRINEHVDAGSTVVIDLPTDVAGTFAFLCSVPCGPGHREMKGRIVIEG
jgi:cytochrome c oxidase subunit II